MSVSLGLLTVVQVARVFLISSSLGPLVLMIYRMISDMTKWLQLLALVVLAFGLTLHSMLRGSGLLTECEDAGGMAGLEEGLRPATWALFKYAVGAADILELDCLNASPAAMGTMVVYSVLTTILLVNMLIAIMAKTFDDIWEQQERNHQMNFAQLALSWHAATVAPPPLSVFRLLAGLLGDVARWVATCTCTCGPSPSAPTPFRPLEESDLAPTATEAWAQAHTEESLLAAVDAFLDRHGEERAREGKWRTALMRRLGALEMATREARKEFAQAAESIRSLQPPREAPGAEASPSLEPIPAAPPSLEPSPAAPPSPPAAPLPPSSPLLPSPPPQPEPQAAAPNATAPEPKVVPPPPPAAASAPGAAAPGAAPRPESVQRGRESQPSGHSVASIVTSQRLERARGRARTSEAEARPHGGRGRGACGGAGGPAGPGRPPRAQ